MINDRVVVRDHILRCIDVVHTWACYHATVTAKGKIKKPKNAYNWVFCPVHLITLVV